jgi:hypothetical protein
MDYTIIAAKTHKGLTREFKDDKAIIKESDYPADYCLYMAEKYFPYIEKKLSKIPDNSILFVTPTTSNYNDIPEQFATFLKKRNQTLEIVNYKGSVATNKYDYEAKNRLNLDDRNSEPIDFFINADSGLAAKSQKQNVYIIDDFASTGETIIKRQK